MEDIAVIVLEKGYIAILDLVDYERRIPVPDSRHSITPANHSWELRAHSKPRLARYRTAITRIEIERGPAGVRLHRLLFPRGTKPLNGSYLDCRSCNWVASKGRESKRCAICGNTITKNKAKLDKLHLVQVYDKGQIKLLQPCSSACHKRAERALQSLLKAAENGIGDVVYFIENCSQTRIKIGFTKDIRQRLISLQTGCHEKLQLIGCIPGTLEDEKIWHAAWAASRTQGEWFASNKRIRHRIENVIGLKYWEEDAEDG